MDRRQRITRKPKTPSLYMFARGAISGLCGIMLALILTGCPGSRVSDDKKEVYEPNPDGFSVFTAPDLDPAIPATFILGFRERSNPYIDGLLQYLEVSVKGEMSPEEDGDPRAIVLMSFNVEKDDIEAFLAGEMVSAVDIPFAHSRPYVSYGEGFWLPDDGETPTIDREYETVRIEEWNEDGRVRLEIHLGPPILGISEPSPLEEAPVTVHVEGIPNIGCESNVNGSIQNDPDFSVFPFCIQVADWGVQEHLD